MTRRDTDVVSGAAGAGLRELSDPALVRVCLEDDQDAWRELVDRYQRLVFSIPRRYGLPEADCHDVFQKVFEALVRELPRLRDGQSLAKWLMTAAHRWAWRQMKSAADRTQPVDADARDPGAPPAEQASRWEQTHLVQQALRRLGEPCERLLTALYLEDPRPSYEQLALRLGLAVGSIGPTRARCLARLVETLRGTDLARQLAGE